MKKIIYILTFLLFTSLNAQANDYSFYCSNSNAKKTFNGIFKSTIGFNTLSKKIVEHEITKAIKKDLKSDLKIKITNFYGVDFLGGEFNSLNAKAKNFSYGGYYFSDLNAQTICPYNKVSRQNNKIVFDENFVLKFNTKITQDDLNKFSFSKNYKKIIEQMNKDPMISKMVKITNAKIEIDEDRLVLKYDFSPLPKLNLNSLFNGHLLNSFRVSINAGLKVVDNKIELCNLKINSVSMDYNKLATLLNSFNPLKYSLKVDNQKTNLIIENVKIKNSIIYIDGYSIIEKSKNSLTAN